MGVESFHARSSASPMSNWKGGTMAYQDGFRATAMFAVLALGRSGLRFGGRDAFATAGSGGPRLVARHEGRLRADRFDVKRLAPPGRGVGRAAVPDAEIAGNLDREMQDQLVVVHVELGAIA